MTAPSDNDAFVLLQAHTPPGMVAWQDFSSTAAIGRMWRAVAQGFNAYGWQILATLRSELQALNMVQRLPDWETIMGFANDSIALFGTAAQRRLRILGRRREAGGPSIATIQAVLGPVLGYADPGGQLTPYAPGLTNALQIVECDRPSLTTANTYTNSTGGTASNSTVTQTVNVLDCAKVSQAGIRLHFAGVMVGGVNTGTTFVITSPSSLTYTAKLVTLFPGAVTTPFDIWFPTAAGDTCGGTWTVAVTCTAASAFAWTSFALLVEGVGLGNWIAPGNVASTVDGHGSEQFRWAAFINPALVGRAAAADIAGALATITRIQPGHDGGALALSTQITQAGTITTSTSSTAVVGAGTAFTGLAVGQQISTDAASWGTISAIANDTHLTLTANAPTTAAASAWYSRGQIPAVPDDNNCIPDMILPG